MVALSRVRGLKQVWARLGKNALTVALSRVRGLKHQPTLTSPAAKRRTLTSAWIETNNDYRIRRRRPVALSRVRGLKHGRRSIRYQGHPVALSRVRGLKQAVNNILKQRKGRTLTSAWIETSS